MANLKFQAGLDADSGSHYSTAIIAFLPITAVMVITGPQGLTWLVTLMTFVAAYAVLATGRFQGLLARTAEARLFAVCAGVFLLWAIFRTVTSVNLSDAVFGTAAFLFSLLSAAAGCILVYRFAPSGRWLWKFFPIANILFALLLTVVLAHVMYMLTIRPPTMRHQNPYHYNRGAVFIILLMPVAWYAITRFAPDRRQCLIWSASVTGAAGAAAGFISESESAKLILMAIPAVYIAYLYRPEITRHVLIAGVFVMTLLGPFIVNATFDFIRETPILWNFRPGTFAERVLVWESHFELIMRAPLIGNSVEFFRTYGSLHPITKQPYFHNHAHSYIIQVWLDLGAIGAFSLALTLAAALYWTRVLPRAQGAMLTAMIVGMICVWAVSHGMWQSWYIGMCGILLMTALLGIRRAEIEDENRSVAG